MAIFTSIKYSKTIKGGPKGRAVRYYSSAIGQGLGLRGIHFRPCRGVRHRFWWENLPKIKDDFLTTIDTNIK